MKTRTVPFAVLMLTSLASADRGDPRVLVVIPEQIIRRPAPDPAVETAVSNHLLEAGLTLVDLGQSQELQAREVVIRYLNGKLDTASLLRLKTQFKADVLVTGEAFAEEITNPPAELRNAGFSAFTSRYELKVIDLATARILYQKAFTGSGAALTPLIAGKTALENIGEEAGAYLSPKLYQWAKGGTTAPARAYVMRVSGIKSYSIYKAVLDKLRLQGNVTRVDSRQYDPKDAEFEVSYNGSAENLAVMLERLGFRITKLSAGEIRATYTR